MSGRSRWARMGVAIAFVAMVTALGACSGAGEPAAAPVTGSSVDPRPPADPGGQDPVDRSDALLRIDDVRPLPAFGLDTREQPVLDPQQFTLGTLRGPCGATVETPFAAGAFRVFRSTVSLVVEAVAEPGADEAAAFVEGLRADAEPGCATFEEQLGAAEPSALTLDAMLDLSPLGDHGIGWTQEVTASTGRVGYRAILVAAAGDRLWLLAVLSPNPIPVADLVGLGQLASSRAGGG